MHVIFRLAFGKLVGSNIDYTAVLGNVVDSSRLQNTPDRFSDQKGFHPTYRKQRMKKVLCLAAASSVLVTACGGGNSSSPAAPTPVVAVVPAPPATPPTPPIAPPTAPPTPTASVAACFELKPGIKFLKSNDFKQLNTQETFEGVNAFAGVELRSDDTRSGARYQTISGGFVHLLGLYDYTQQGVLAGKAVYSSSAQIPLDFAPGQTVPLNYTVTSTSNAVGSTSTKNVNSSLTFVGFENLKLGGRVFANTCKIKLLESVAGDAEVIWFAQGFGFIASETQNAQGATVTGSRVELVTVLAGP